MNTSSQTVGASLRVLYASVVIAALAAVAWFHAPIVPAVTGAVGAGLILRWRQQRT